MKLTKFFLTPTSVATMIISVTPITTVAFRAVRLVERRAMILAVSGTYLAAARRKEVPVVLKIFLRYFPTRLAVELMPRLEKKASGARIFFLKCRWPRKIWANGALWSLKLLTTASTVRAAA